MTDFEAPSSLRAIDALRQGRTRELLVRFGGWLAPSEAAAEDLLGDALLMVCDPEGRPWDHTGGSFLAHMRVVMRDLALAVRRSARARREELGTDVFELMPHTAPGPEDAVATAREVERLRHMGAKLRERIAPVDRTLRVFDAVCDGASATEIAERLGCGVDEIYDSNRQIARHAAKVMAWQREAEEASMKARREGAKDKRTS